jgi:16S rRNA (uracil1498-N3)-methyltransferase
MSLPFFYIEQSDPQSSLITLNEETSKHVVQVLRMKAGEQLQLTDGKGNLLLAEINVAQKRNCVVRIINKTFTSSSIKKVTIAISLVKNASRFEWFLEKATEIGVQEIIPLICERTERQHFRFDRMKGILVSAMLQSQQTWLPVLHEAVKFEEYIRQVTWSDEYEKAGVGSRQTGASDGAYKFIAHCEDGNKQSIKQTMEAGASMYTILIGPEGDFTPNEIQLATENNFIPVSLGETRLRTETAGITAAVLLCI